MLLKKHLNLENMALSMPLAVLVAYFFFWSRNNHMFTADQLLFSLLILLLGASFILVAATALIRVFITLFPVGSHAQKSFVTDFACTTMSLALLVFLLKTLLPPDTNRYLLFFLIVGFGSILISTFKLHKIFATFLLVLLVLNLGSFFYGLISTSASTHREDNFYARANIQLENKPDIYLFILESYQSLDIMKSVYNIDTARISNFLTANSFSIYNASYSNSPFTLLSLADLFSQQDYSQLERGHMDVSLDIRSLIGGNDNNFILKTLKNNGYYTESLYLANQNYYTFKRGKNLDKFDTAFVSETDRLSQPLYLINDNLYAAAALFFGQPAPTMLQTAVESFLAGKPTDVPSFVSIKTGADHSPNFGYSWRQADEWAASGVYKSMIENSWAELKLELARIIKENPKALIVMVGDHGAHRLRNFLPDTITADAKIDELCTKRNISRQDIADDIFKVFISIRMPDGTKDISDGFVISPRNIFMHIFAALNQDKSLLQQRSPSISKVDNLMMVREGIVLDSWLSN